MELSSILVPSNTFAKISGPNATTFNQRSVLDLANDVRNHWQSGRPTAPSYGALLYAPDGANNVSASYFNDQASKYVDKIEIFSAPAVQEPISGRPWGMHANISCKPVRKNELQILEVNDFTYGINQCNQDTCEGSFEEMCRLQGFKKVTDLPIQDCHADNWFPPWVNRTSSSGLLTQFSYIAAADGASGKQGGPFFFGPYSITDSHDNSTYDSVAKERPPEDTTTGIFEIFLWESSLLNDSVLANLTNGDFPNPVEVIHQPLNQYHPDNTTNFAGIAVHCDVMSAVGYADLDPARRTFREFKPSRALANAEQASNQGDNSAVQTLALSSLARDKDPGSMSAADAGLVLNANGNEQDVNDQTWIALHAAIGSMALPPTEFDPSYSVAPMEQYHALTPRDLQFAMYKLLGESVIALMDEGGVEVWEGPLRSLQRRAYLVSSVVSWKLVLVLLFLWATLVSLGATWMIIFGGPRWAPSLDGFEMFKFEAQYGEEVNEFSGADFRMCQTALDKVPGMVGMLPGTGSGIDKDLGFIGLSENRAGKDATYTLDRWQASQTRPVP
ncbi:MAG: hypothetical protein Q9160_004626 [Pyrenula sp. 1 TL-2023]